jgi:hypothetical protein
MRVDVNKARGDYFAGGIDFLDPAIESLPDSNDLIALHRHIGLPRSTAITVDHPTTTNH